MACAPRPLQVGRWCRQVAGRQVAGGQAGKRCWQVAGGQDEGGRLQGGWTRAAGQRRHRAGPLLGSREGGSAACSENVVNGFLGLAPAEYTKRGDDFRQELDFVFANLVM